jgi:hypothetical protein
MPRFPPTEEGPRLFTVEEANALVPALELEFARVARVRADLAAAIAAVGGGDVAAGILQGERAPPPGREAYGERLRVLAGEITACIERLNGLGCLVKDLETGLVDFYSLRDDEVVFLCWQFGEPAVTQWHTLEDGFAGRQPIEGARLPEPAFRN